MHSSSVQFETKEFFVQLSSSILEPTSLRKACMYHLQIRKGTV